MAQRIAESSNADAQKHLATLLCQIERASNSVVLACGVHMHAPMPHLVDVQVTEDVQEHRYVEYHRHTSS